jgi:hypothetical protein
LIPAITTGVVGLQTEASDNAEIRVASSGLTNSAGIGVDEDLVTRLVADTDSGDALPLLAYTLAQLAADPPAG